MFIAVYTCTRTGEMHLVTLEVLMCPKFSQDRDIILQTGRFVVVIVVVLLCKQRCAYLGPYFSIHVNSYPGKVIKIRSNGQEVIIWPKNQV